MNFAQLDGEQGTEVQTTVVVDKAPKTNDDVIKNFLGKIQSNPELKNALYSFSGFVRVGNTYGYGETGGLIQENPGVAIIDPATGLPVRDEKGKIKKEGREVAVTSKIVGYSVENIGTQPISYLTEEYKLENGIAVGTAVEKVLAPGETAILARKYMTYFASRPEISFKFENGKMVQVDPTKKAGKSIDEILEAHHFEFNGDIGVHDDTIKIAIADRVSEREVNGKTVGEYKVNNTYFSVFGFLDNPTARNERKTSGGGGSGDNKQALKLAAAADFIFNLSQKSLK